MGFPDQQKLWSVPLTYSCYTSKAKKKKKKKVWVISKAKKKKKKKSCLVVLHCPPLI